MAYGVLIGPPILVVPSREYGALLMLLFTREQRWRAKNMHELSIAQSIFDVVETRATELHATHVKGVRLRIGEASGIVTDSLTFCFEMLASFDPIVAGAQLSVDTVPHRARCRHCAKEFPVTNFIAQCPTCAEWSNEIISGNELQILDMEIETS